MSKRLVLTFMSLFIVCLMVGRAEAQQTAFTYQGKLTDNGTPANGNYDLQFALFGSASGGTQIGQTQTVTNVSASGGVFTVTLDFGANAFTGAARFLQISMRPSGAAVFTPLTPRQPITSTPYAVRSLNTATADTATNAQQLGGVAAGQYVKTDDTRLSDQRDPKPGSSNYVQNTTSQQASTNFNISGNGTVGGTLSGNTVNAGTQYNLGGQTVLGVSAQNILKLGNAGNVGIGPTLFPAYKFEVESAGQYGLRVGTGTADGIALSVGGFGSLEVDANGIPAGRFIVKENGNVGIGIRNPTSKLTVAGTVESTVGFKFPDGSLQSTAANLAIGKVHTTGLIVTELEITHTGFVTDIATLNLPPGVYLITFMAEFENRANDFLQDNKRTVRCFLINEFLGVNRMGAPGNPMDLLTATGHTVLTQSANGPVSLRCGVVFEIRSQVFAKARRLTAVRMAEIAQ
jgi:hypothetical protein